MFLDAWDERSLNATEVPLDKADAFDLILAKPHNFYTGYMREFWHKNDFAYVDTRYDNDLAALGLLKGRINA